MQSFKNLSGSVFLTLLLSAAAIGQPLASSGQLMAEAAQKKKQLQNASVFHSYPIRNVGPVIQGGRVTDIDVHPNNPNTYYVAYASGGVFKTTNNGASFEPVFDGNDALGVGNISVSPANPDIVWVGSGENNSSRSSYAGAGIFKSMDGGKTWQHMGLRHSQHMGRIVSHPTDANTAWVASLGALYSHNSERGLYKTTDGGQTWRKTLFVNDSTGVIDIAIHPKNPNILWATSWERSRWAWNFKGNGVGTAIWKSDDGGETWARSMQGFPSGAHVGRIGLAVSQSNPDVVYAILDNQEEVRIDLPRQQAPRGLTATQIRGMNTTQFQNIENSSLESFLRDNRYPAKYTAASVKRSVARGDFSTGDIADYLGDGSTPTFRTTIKGAEVYRSDDGGKSWKKTHEPRIDALYNTFGYYFGEIRVSPIDENEIYILGVPLLRSVDGGKLFEQIDNVQVDEYGNRVHVDHQAMWINPSNTSHIILGNDGGLYVTWDRGTNWTHYNNKPVGQFYTVNVDMATPYNIYGGMQDNGVYFGSSRSVPNRSPHWQPISGGDGMHVVPDPRNHNIVISGSQFGSYARYDLEKGTRRSITPAAEIGLPRHRFNWNTPVIQSPHNPDIIYMGSQYFMRSLNQGDDFEILSVDLTKNRPQGNVPYSTITTISESPQEFGTIWVGTDDGNIHLTRDAGKTWTNVIGSLPADLWVAKIQASPHENGTAFVALTGYRYDDFNAYLYKTTDFGKTWTSIVGDMPNEATNIIIQDRVNPDLLFAGTDHGSYSSFNGGVNWHPLSGMPNVASYDMVIHPRENDLVIGTHGRSIFIMDVKPLQSLTRDKVGESVLVWEPEQMRRMPNWGTPRAPIYSTPAPTPEMPILFYSGTGGTAKVKISNEDGTFVHESSVDSKKGFGIYNWNLMGKNSNESSYAAVGTYKLEMTIGGKTATTKITLVR
jgi:photosystem II stability/assembly factor-like uncharacterized protein